MINPRTKELFACGTTVACGVVFGLYFVFWFIAEGEGGRFSSPPIPDSVDCTTLLSDQQSMIDRNRPIPEGYLPDDFASLHDSILCNGTKFLLGYGWSYDTVRLAWCHEGSPHSILLDEIELYARWWEGDVPGDQFGVLKVFRGSTAYSYDDLYIIDCGGAKPTVALVLREYMWNLGPDGLQTVDNSALSLSDLTIRDTTTRIRDMDDSIETEVFPNRRLQFDSLRRIYYERLIFLDVVRAIEEEGNRGIADIRDSVPMVHYSFAVDEAAVYWRDRWWRLSDDGRQLQAVYQVSNGY